MADVKEIFAEAIELPAEQRAAFVDARCGGDASLRAAVEALLAAHERAGGFLAGPTVDTAESPSPDVSTERGAPSQQIGRYKLIESIGEGGFGTVWLAEQSHPVRRRVALKLIKLGMDTHQVIARFEAERQALAMMDHPNIAKVFDAGATETGRPYFVMELVDGVPVTQYCDANHLTPRQRLELFVPICQAVQHAHQKGIIHRDLKPSNVLITIHDGKPVPKVIDFGIAKATEARLTEKTVFTELRQMIGTPEYMSPEQAEPVAPIDIDTRSDVYSLGVLLYELLIGATPFEGKELRSKAYHEIQRMIREVDPPPPSTRFSTLVAQANVAANRSMEPRKLSALVRGELDWIVMKCLEKDRTRRYDSASALSNDVMRYLADEPVEAGPPSKAYRFRKLVRRHKLGLATAAVVVLALAGGLAVATWGLLRATRERDNAIAARKSEERAHQAELEQRAIKEQVNAFVREMFYSIRPAQARGKPVLVRDLLDTAVDRLDTAFANRPAVEGDLRMFFGSTYLSLGLGQQAVEELRTAVQLLRDSHSDDRLSEALYILGRAQEYLGQSSDAVKSFSESITLSNTPESVFAAKRQLASILMKQNRLTEASAAQEEIIEYRIKRYGPEAQDTLQARADLAWTRDLQGRFAESEAILRDVIAAGQRSLGADSPHILAFENSLAQVLADQGKFDEAEPVMRRVVSEATKIMGPRHLNTLIAQSVLGKLLVRMRRLDEAEQVLNDCIAKFKDTFGNEHQNCLVAETELAMCHRGQGKLEQADAEAADVQQRFSRTLGPNHPETLMAATKRAVIVIERGDADQARQIIRDALPNLRKALGGDHPEALTTMSTLGQAFARQGNWADAEPLLSETYEAAKRSNRLAAHPEYAAYYGICLAKQGRHEQALPLLLEAQKLERSRAADSRLLAEINDALQPVESSTRPTTAP